MRLYKILFEDFGGEVILHPSIPKYPAKKEDRIAPRICTAPTIPMCIHSLELFSHLIGEITTKEVFVYYCDLDNYDNLVFPTQDQVPDAWLTGEVWITTDYKFYKLYDAVFGKHMYIPNSPYSRYYFKKKELEMSDLPDYMYARNIYGTEEYFSILEADPNRKNNTLDINEWYKSQ